MAPSDVDTFVDDMMSHWHLHPSCIASQHFCRPEQISKIYIMSRRSVLMMDRLAQPQKRHKHGEEHEGEDFMDVTTDGFVPEKQSRKIFKYARQLQDDGQLPPALGTDLAFPSEKEVPASFPL